MMLKIFLDAQNFNKISKSFDKAKARNLWWFQGWVWTGRCLQCKCHHSPCGASLSITYEPAGLLKPIKSLRLSFYAPSWWNEVALLLLPCVFTLLIAKNLTFKAINMSHFLSPCYVSRCCWLTRTHACTLQCARAVHTRTSAPCTLQISFVSPRKCAYATTVLLLLLSGDGLELNLNLAWTNECLYTH